MRYLLTFAVMITMTFLSSCSNDEDFPGERVSGEVDFSISTSIPTTLMTRSSGDGGVTNVDKNRYDLRYICEVWTKDRRLAYREVKTTGDFISKVTFSARLIALDYDFVFWADFVDKGQVADKFYKTDHTEGLRDIEMLSYGILDETRDAYFAAVNVDLTRHEVANPDVILKRPFGKIRLVATDEVQTGEAAGLNEVPRLVKVDYTDFLFPAGFNALNGNATDRTIRATEVYQGTPLRENVVVEGVEHSGCYVLSFDYILVSPAVTAVSLNVKTYSDLAGTSLIGDKDISAIPVQANKLTTVIGNLYTNRGVMMIRVDEAFDGHFDVPAAPAPDQTSMVVVNPLYTEMNSIIQGPDNQLYKVGTNAFSAIEAAMSAVDANGKVLLTAGTYTYIGNAGNGALSVKKGITLEGQGEATIIQGQIAPEADVTIRNLRIHQSVEGNVAMNYAPLYLVAAKSENITVEGVTFTTVNTGTNSSTGATAVYANKKITIRDCQFHTFWKAIFISGQPSIVLEDNTFHDINPISFKARYDGEVVIARNTFSRNSVLDVQVMDISPALDSELVFNVFMGVALNVKSVSNDFSHFINTIRTQNTWTGSEASSKPISIRSGSETYKLKSELR